MREVPLLGPVAEPLPRRLIVPGRAKPRLRLKGASANTPPPIVSVPGVTRPRRRHAPPVGFRFGDEDWDAGTLRLAAAFEVEREPVEIHVPNKALWPPARRTTAPAVGRNDPCSCGSGRKSKRCCAA